MSGAARDPRPPRITSVAGGVGGLDAQHAALIDLARHYDDAGDRARRWSLLGPDTAADPDLLESSILSPGTFARAEAAVLRATVGPDGALGRAIAWEAEAVAVRVALDLLVAADRAAHEAIEVRDQALGHVVGGLAAAAVALAPPGVVPAVALAARLGALDGLGGLVGDAAVAHPGAVQALVNGGGGVVDGVLGLPGLVAPALAPPHPDTASGAGALAGLYDDGEPGVQPLDPATLHDLAAAEGVPVPELGRPADLAGLLATLGGVAGLSVGAGSQLNGTVAVTTLTGPDGRQQHLVYVPGTDDMATTPWSQDGDVRDMGTNLDLVAGHPTSYAAGVLEAMHQAGVRPGDPVLLVGHSQGGMVAGALAAQGSPYAVGHVVTAGSPLAQVDLPAGVHALSLENVGDVVPLTDGEPNAPTVGHVTVTFDGGGQGITGHHGYPQYVAGAGAADASTDPSVAAALDELHASGFLGAGPGTGVHSQVFQITRG